MIANISTHGHANSTIWICARSHGLLDQSQAFLACFFTSVLCNGRLSRRRVSRSRAKTRTSVQVEHLYEVFHHASNHQKRDSHPSTTPIAHYDVLARSKLVIVCFDDKHGDYEQAQHHSYPRNGQTTARSLAHLRRQRRCRPSRLSSDIRWLYGSRIGWIANCQEHQIRSWHYLRQRHNPAHVRRQHL